MLPGTLLTNGINYSAEKYIGFDYIDPKILKNKSVKGCVESILSRKILS